MSDENNIINNNISIITVPATTTRVIEFLTTSDQDDANNQINCLTILLDAKNNDVETSKILIIYTRIIPAAVIIGIILQILTLCVLIRRPFRTPRGVLWRLFRILSKWKTNSKKYQTKNFQAKALTHSSLQNVAFSFYTYVRANTFCDLIVLTLYGLTTFTYFQPNEIVNSQVLAYYDLLGREFICNALAFYSVCLNVLIAVDRLFIVQSKQGVYCPKRTNYLQSLKNKIYKFFDITGKRSSTMCINVIQFNNVSSTNISELKNEHEPSIDNCSINSDKRRNRDERTSGEGFIGNTKERSNSHLANAIFHLKKRAFYTITNRRPYQFLGIILLISFLLYLPSAFIRKIKKCSISSVYNIWKPPEMKEFTFYYQDITPMLYKFDIYNKYLLPIMRNVVSTFIIVVVNLILWRYVQKNGKNNKNLKIYGTDVNMDKSKNVGRNHSNKINKYRRRLSNIPFYSITTHSSPKENAINLSPKNLLEKPSTIESPDITQIEESSNGIMNEKKTKEEKVQRILKISSKDLERLDKHFQHKNEMDQIIRINICAQHSTNLRKGKDRSSSDSLSNRTKEKKPVFGRANSETATAKHSAVTKEKQNIFVGKKIAKKKRYDIERTLNLLVIVLSLNFFFGHVLNIYSSIRYGIVTNLRNHFL
ncbi:hypothetical protein SNEBB_010353 [Seison nebaliae]|nr:hypothetical protein SNEBB_010353 [Seison nebaliae]